MNKELQNKAWNVLPKEFKEEVKKLYRGFTFTREGYYVELFGIHNLTSDAEGEEMLHIRRSEVTSRYEAYSKESANVKNNEPYLQFCEGRLNVLTNLFGSKCLPDNVDNLSQNSPENYDKTNRISTDDNKPSEPKFKVGDKVTYKGMLRVISLIDAVTHRYHLSNGSYYAEWVDEYDLEPHTEPEEESRNLSQETANCDKQFDNILKDGFRNERRLNIAAMAMQGILSNPQLLKIAIETYQEEIGSPDIHVAVAKTAKEQADALIAECEQTEKLKEN